MEKKTHAALKRFKEAAASSKDIKTLTSRKDEIDHELELVSVELAACRERISARESALSEAKTALRAAQKDTDLKRFEVLLEKARLLVKCKEELQCSAHSSDTKLAAIAIELLSVELQVCLYHLTSFLCLLLNNDYYICMCVYM